LLGDFKPRKMSMAWNLELSRLMDVISFWKLSGFLEKDSRNTLGVSSGDVFKASKRIPKLVGYLRLVNKNPELVKQPSS